MSNNLRIDFSHRKAKGKITVLYFLDNGIHVAFVPSLNLSAYGDSPKEATDMLFGVVMDDFMSNLTDLGIDGATNELKKLGWKSNRFFKKKFEADPFGPYVDKEGILTNFNLPKETSIDTKVVSI